MTQKAFQLLCSLALTALLGCGAVEQARNAAKQQQLANFLKQLGSGIHNGHDALGRAPANWQELQQHGVPAEVQQILESEGYQFLFWNVTFSDVTGGTANYIAAHPADAATNGGTVLLMDGAVMRMTGQEFSDALAKQKTESPKAMAAAAGAAGGGGAAAPAPPAGAGPPGPPAAPGY